MKDSQTQKDLETLIVMIGRSAIGGLLLKPFKGQNEPI